MTGTEEAKGPKVDIPDELVDELSSSEGEADATQPSIEIDVDVDESGDEPSGEASAESAERDELAELNDKYLRLAAEFDNFRRRTLRERQELLLFGTESLVKDLLTTIDNLERALAHAEDVEGSRENMLEGVELTYRSLLQTLEKLGVKAVEALGEPFDPQVHEAIQQVAAGAHEPGSVVDVYQKGYLLKNRLLRPALVVVAGPGEKATN